MACAVQRVSDAMPSKEHIAIDVGCRVSSITGKLRRLAKYSLGNTHDCVSMKSGTRLPCARNHAGTRNELPCLHVKVLFPGTLVPYTIVMETTTTLLNRWLLF